MSEFDRDRKTQEHDPKHTAGFVAKPVLPGENPEDFDLLLDDLWDQYDPKGPVEEDAVETIAHAIWRKNHLDVFNRAFVARKKLGSFFEYPGDPDGDTRILQEICRQARARHLQNMTTWVARLAEERLVETSEAVSKANGNSTNQATETSASGDARKDQTADSGDDATDVIIPDDVRKMVDSTVCEIDAISGTGGDERPIDTELKSNIVSRIVEGAMEADRKNTKSSKYLPIDEEITERRGQINRLKTTYEMAFGRGFVEEMETKLRNEDIEQALAKFGELLTPDHYAAELQFVERLDATIERAHARLMKYQAERLKRSATKFASLQPDWAARRR